jgi:hypothetical protein
MPSASRSWSPAAADAKVDDPAVVGGVDGDEVRGRAIDLGHGVAHAGRGRDLG